MMKVTEGELQDLYRQHTGGGDREACLTAEVIADLARGELSAEERRRAAIHLADCSDCSLELRMVRGLESWAADLAPKLEGGSAQPRGREAGAVTDLAAARQARDASRRGLARPRWLPAAIAAGLALVVGSAYLLTPSAPAPPGDVTRAESVAGLEPAVGTAVEEAPELFRWPAQQGAASYRVRLFDASAELLWESEPLRGPEARLPSEIRHRLESGSTYSWTVTMEGAVQRSRLGPFAFRVGPE